MSAISANERIQYDLHPWTSYVIVPLFALANTGIHLTGHLLSDAATSPITLGILFGYVVGKPIGSFIGSWLSSRPWLHGPRSPLSKPLLVGVGTCAGIGFTVSLLISSIAFTGQRLDEARLGALATVVGRAGGRLGRVRGHQTTTPGGTRPPDRWHRRGHPRSTEDPDPERDHIRGPDEPR